MTTPTGNEPSLSGAQPPETPQTSGNEPMLAIDAAVRDLLAAMSHIDSRERAAAIDLITELGDAGLAPLVRALDDLNPDTRMCAVRALGLIGDERTIPHVVRMLTDEVELVRQVAGIAFVSFGETIADQFIELAEQGDHLMCDALLVGLHHIYDGTSEAVPLINAITSRGGRALPALIKLRLVETHWLGVLWEEVFLSFDAILFAPLVEYFDYFSDPSIDVFNYCVDVLTRTPDLPEHIDPYQYMCECFLMSLYVPRTERQYVWSLLALAQSDATVPPRLLEMYPHVPTEKQELLAYIFSQTGTYQAVPLLIETLESSGTKSNTVQTLLRALGNLHDPESLEAIRAVHKKTKDTMVKRTAEWAISEIESA